MNVSAAFDRSGTRAASSVLAAVAIGAVSTVNPFAAAGLLVCVVLLIGCYRQPRFMIVILTASVFLEVISFGGVTISRLIAPLALLVTVYALSIGAAHLTLGPPLFWTSLYALWAAASLLWTTDGAGTITLLAGLAIALIYMISFASLVESTETLVRIIIAFVIAAVCVGVFAIAAFMGLVGGGSLEEGRTSGAVGDANFFAAYELVALPLALALANIVQRRDASLALYGASGILIGAILTTISRGGILALAAVLLTMVIVPSKTLFRSGAQKIGALAVVFVTAGVLLYTLSGTFAPRIQAMFKGGGGGSGREVLWSGARTSIGERPVLGLGYGAFASNSNELILRTPNIQLTTYDLRPAGEVAHSAYIGTAAELGIPGLVLLVAVLVSTGRYLRRVARVAVATGDETAGRIASALVISLIGWATASFFLSSETSRPVWIVIGIALALGKLAGADREGAAAV